MQGAGIVSESKKIIIMMISDLALWVGRRVVVVCGGEGDTASSDWAFSSICVPLCTGTFPSSKSFIIIIIMSSSPSYRCLALPWPWSTIKENAD